MVDVRLIRSAADQQVTASTLVRQFGTWQERASRAPVYVLHHGRPRLMLVALDLLDALFTESGARDSGEADAVTLGAVIDAVEQPILIVNGDGVIGMANAAARARFGAVAMPGGAPATLSQVGGTFLAEAVTRVLDGGPAEAVELIPDRFPERRLQIVVAPVPGGCVLRIDDATAAERLRTIQAERDATVAALEATGVAAVARVSLRGYLVAPRPGLVAISGVPEDQLATARFLSLIAVTDRPGVGEALEQASGGAAPDAVSAELLVRGAAPLRVRIGFAAVRVGGRVEEVIAAIGVDRA